METVIAFIVIFGTLVAFHEFGHFLFAKRAGIMVREFAIGMGPKILAIRKGETQYTIRLLPLGGYVRMAGEDFDTVELQPGYRVGLLLNAQDEIEKIYLNRNVSNPNILNVEVEKSDLDKELYIEGYDEDGQFVHLKISRTAMIIEKGQETLIAPYDRQFESKSLGSRALAIFAGPLFNFILAFFIFLALGLMNGVPTNEPIISEVKPDTPAEIAGMKKDDLITGVDGKSIDSWPKFSEAIQKSAGVPMSIEVDRAGKQVVLDVVPDTVEDAGQEFGQIGVMYSSPLEKGFIKSIVFGAEQTYTWTVKIFELLGMLVTGQFTIDALSGPVGIYKATEEVAQHGIFNLMNWGAVLSINLGIMNLLPLPALDGGRLLFFLFEGLRGKPIDKQKEGMVHFVGIMLLMVLMLVVTWNDIQRFFF
ncbi:MULTISPECIES: RIP metalloprotease RseP [unclassified Sporosarcina]|uniref:RIP metalloprotease RseP n=1 Tax=unclassified Sporosarcina TaxID=2647733 RepID=UPI000C16A9FA|nr:MULTISPECIES: RIP metalloprotease RseP [unclassified Sporosarcina]PID06877.1 RIP metalloprotease RseP [Sporosarcina sp. P30]PID10071.1 RIP metalloprotease RseP [Sporosarcina sp. P31]PID13650.1 RIP metalloprotease RseP [Sporosarcina sp. P32b]